MAAMTEIKCAWCKSPKKVRQADVNRGWGKFCSKRCKAKKQEKENGQHAAYLDGRGVSHLRGGKLPASFREDRANRDDLRRYDFEDDADEHNNSLFDDEADYSWDAHKSY